jgi:type I restriction enzyme M protein
MLDTETKTRINTGRDILVGKVPDPKSQVEQITIALIYKFMDDMDVESEELGGKRTFFVGEYAKYAWRKIFDPRQSGYDLLILYSEAIGKMDVNPGIPKLFRDIFKNAYLPYRDPETLKSFLKIINEFDYSHSEKLGDAFEFLLSILGSQGDAGQFRTPRHIIDFMVEIVDPKKNETMLDPACGTAGFLISSYKHIIKQNSSNYSPDESNGVSGNGNQSVHELIITSNGYNGDKLSADERRILADNMHGYDISPDMVRLSLVNMYLHGIKEPHISEYDTLTSEDNWNHYSDVILANPPFMSPKGGIRPHKRFSITSNRSEVLFVDYIAEHLTPDGRAAVIVPEGIIFQSGKAYKQLRKMLVEQYLVGVISLPAGVFNPYSGVKTSILWLDKSLAKRTDKILFVKIENDGFDLGAQRRAIKENDLPEVLRLIKHYQMTLHDKDDHEYSSADKIITVSKSDISKTDEYNLSGDRYKISKVYSGKYPKMKIKEIGTVESGYVFPLDKQGDNNKPIPFYKVSDMNLPGNEIFMKVQNNTIDRNGLNDLRAKSFPVNTIIFPKIGAAIATNKKRILTKEAVVDNNVMGIIPNGTINPIYLYSILRSINISIWASEAQPPSMKKTTVEEFEIPVPPITIQEEIVGEIESYQKIIDGARMVVENYKPRIAIDPEWEMVGLGEVCELSTGGTPKSTIKEYYEGGEIRWLVSGDIHKEEIYDCEGRITELGFKNSNTRFLPLNSVLIALNGQGKTRGTVAILRVKATCNQSIVAIHPLEENVLLPEFLYLQLKAKYQDIRDITGDNQRSGLNMPIIRGIKIYVPEISVQKKLVSEFKQESELVKSNIVLIEKFEQKIKDRIAKVWGE